MDRLEGVRPRGSSSGHAWNIEKGSPNTGLAKQAFAVVNPMPHGLPSVADEKRSAAPHSDGAGPPSPCVPSVWESPVGTSQTSQRRVRWHS